MSMNRQVTSNNNAQTSNASKCHELVEFARIGRKYTLESEARGRKTRLRLSPIQELKVSGSPKTAVMDVVAMVQRILVMYRYSLHRQ